MASFVARPIADDLESERGRHRLFLHDGALLTQSHFQDEQRYHRAQLAALALHLHGAGTIAGLNVSLEPPAGGADTEVQVAPGLALDRLGRLIELPHKSCLPLAVWLARQADSPESRARVAAGLRPAGGGRPEHLIADVYLKYMASARRPEPSFATGNADTIDSIQPSRILDTGKLNLLIRSSADDRIPDGQAAANITAPVTADKVREFKRMRAWSLNQPLAEPFRLPAGGDDTEHVLAGGLQDGTEILLARLVIPVRTGGTFAVFDTAVDLGQAAFSPDQSIRPYSYSAAELALLATIRR